MIYGAGVLGQGLYCVLKKLGLEKNILGFMVSEHADHMNDFMGIPIKCMSEFQLEEVTIIVSVKEKFLEDINKNLENVSEKKICWNKDFKRNISIRRIGYPREYERNSGKHAINR